jgi:hypothetical protein
MSMVVKDSILPVFWGVDFLFYGDRFLLFLVKSYSDEIMLEEKNVSSDLKVLEITINKLLYLKLLCGVCII